jgi:hypothetical protein
MTTNMDGGPSVPEYRSRGLPVRPSELPELRHHLLGLWAPTGLLARSERQRAPGASFTLQHGWDPEKAISWERTQLERASLWWVSAEMVDVLLAAAAGVPGDVTPEEIEPIAQTGFIVLEKPWIGLAIEGGERPLRIDAFLWGKVTLPPLRAGDTEMVRGVSISTYQHEDLGPNPYAYNGRVWLNLGRSDWPMGNRLDDAPWTMTEEARASFSEDRRILAALMTLLGHGGIATVRETAPPRGVARRLYRTAGLPDTATYKVVTLREVHTGPRTTLDGERRPASHRTIVNGFWRRQPYGPRNSLRRLQFIDPYVRGPEDAPLVVRETVHAWRR